MYRVILSRKPCISGKYNYLPYPYDCGWSAPVVGLSKQMNKACFIQKKKTSALHVAFEVAFECHTNCAQ